jgi:hypothetical protein
MTSIQNPVLIPMIYGSFTMLNRFTGSCSFGYVSHLNNPTTIVWNFGDGNISTELSPNHTYIESGEYWPTITATNEYGSSTHKLYSYTKL